MGTMKSMALLYCLDKLLTEHKFYRSAVEEEFKISKPSFDRYKQDIRVYLQTYHPEYTLKYKRSTGVYYLLDSCPK